MRAMLCRHLLWTLPAALAAGILGCEQVRPTQPSGAATKLGFTGQPTHVAAAEPITPAAQVEVQDAVGTRVPGATGAVTVTLGSNPSGGTLGGTMTVSASQGIATFADLRIDRPGSGYTLLASAAGLSGATSTPFAVTLTFAAVTASGLHTCGLTIVTGAAYCWGANGSGQLGDGTMTNPSSPVLVQAPAGVSFASVTRGRLRLSLGRQRPPPPRRGDDAEAGGAGARAGRARCRRRRGRRRPCRRRGGHGRGRRLLLGPQPRGPARRRDHDEPVDPGARA